jgi:hypothetical protein
MEKDKIFFGEQGLTSTSANHVANMAKEMYQHLEEELGNFSFCSESISLLGANMVPTQYATGKTVEFLESLPDKLHDIAALKSLIAWLREAIKARKKLTDELASIGLEDWCRSQYIEYPHQPVMGHVLTEDEYYGSLSIKERNTYYMLETKCAVIGKFIHEDGKLSTERRRLTAITENPNILRENGRDTTIIRREPSVTTEQVDEVFFELQTKHREYQAALNAIKHKCELAIEQSQLEADTKYKTDSAEYRAVYAELLGRFTEWKHQQAVALQQLKIIIPDSLKPIYEKVNALGK